MLGNKGFQKEQTYYRCCSLGPVLISTCFLTPFKLLPNLPQCHSHSPSNCTTSLNQGYKHSFCLFMLKTFLYQCQSEFTDSSVYSRSHLCFRRRRQRGLCPVCITKGTAKFVLIFHILKALN